MSNGLVRQGRVLMLTSISLQAGDEDVSKG